MEAKSSTSPSHIFKIKAPSERTIAFIALIVSVISLGLGIYAVFQPGKVRPLAPAGYAIIRGQSSFPSDLLVLPLEWENTSGRVALIRHPTLVLHELDSKNKETGAEIQFTLAGEYSEISNNAFLQNYIYKFSFIQEPRSIGYHVFAFHYQRWWDDKDKNYAFQFRGNTKYRVSIAYQINDEQEKEEELFDLPVFTRADELQYDRSGSWWDFFYLQ